MAQDKRTTNIATHEQQAPLSKRRKAGSPNATLAMTSAEEAPNMSEDVTDGDVRT